MAGIVDRAIKPFIGMRDLGEMASSSIPLVPDTEIDLSLAGNMELRQEDKVSLLGNDADGSSKNFYSWLPLPSFLSGANRTTAAEATEWIATKKNTLKSWRDFFKFDKFRTPQSVSIAGKRLLTNVEQFQSNYICVSIILIVYCVLTSPLLLLALICSSGAFYFVRSKIGHRTYKVGNIEFGKGFQYALAGVLSFPLFYLAGAGSAIFWVLGASVFFVGLHALFYASEPVAGADFQMEQV